jgi:hypothetical protein
MNSRISIQVILDQIDKALEKWTLIQYARDNEYQYYRVSNFELQEVMTTLTATINRIVPTSSQYSIDMDEVVAYYRKSNEASIAVDRLAGILRTIRSDYQNGYLESIQELVRADLFSDFLEMASYLHAEGYKDPAAVMAGGVLEEQLRKLCLKNGLPIEDAKPTGNEPKKTSRLNDDLAGHGVYNKLDQKQVTSWLDLRNKAAHGQYTEYTKEQVALMLQGIRDFILRNPA